MILNGRFGKSTPAPVVGIILMAITFILIYIISIVVFFVKIDSEYINIIGIFKKKKIYKSDISSINLFSKEGFFWLTGSTTIATRINLVSKDKIIIADPFYGNIGEMKKALVENYKEKIDETILSKKPILINFQQGKKFAGNLFTSFKGILFYLFIGFFVFLFLKTGLYDNNLQMTHIFLILPMLLIYLEIGYQLNYFMLINENLLIKNHVLFWINKEFKLKDIAQANFESPYRRSDALRITTSDFKSKLYSAGSLREKHWQALKRELRKAGIYFVD